MSYEKTMTLSRKAGPEVEVLVRRCTESDLSDIMELQQKIFDGLSDPGLYSIVEAEEILESLREDFCYAVFFEGRMAAFTMMIGNRISHRNYGTYVGYPEERLPDCVSMEITIVDNDLRGYGLQRFFVEMREEEALKHGAREAFVTISPDNKHSLNNFIVSGYEVVETRPLYGGSMRHILRKYLV